MADPTRLGSTLTLSDLERALDRARRHSEDEWVRMIRYADEVEVKASEHIPDDHFYVMDPNQVALLWPKPAEPILVICRPEHREQAEEIVAKIRDEGGSDG